MDDAIYVPMTGSAPQNRLVFHSVGSSLDHHDWRMLQSYEQYDHRHRKLARCLSLPCDDTACSSVCHLPTDELLSSPALYDTHLCHQHMPVT